jgi:hypothetical protein
MPNLDNVMSISIYLWNNNYNNLWINVWCGHVLKLLTVWNKKNIMWHWPKFENVEN